MKTETFENGFKCGEFWKHSKKEKMEPFENDGVGA